MMEGDRKNILLREGTVISNTGQDSTNIGGKMEGVGQVDLGLIATQLLSSQAKDIGLDNLQAALKRCPARRLLVDPQPKSGETFLTPIFRGLKSCLHVPETQSDTILKCNQVLYEMMGDIQKSPNDIMPQMTNLLPSFIENLGNSKATVRKSTHKNIGTFVKYSKRLEQVVENIITYGLENKNQRTRQHSMLVVPALVSLKATVITTHNQSMKKLVDAVIARLRDTSESVSKTAKKLILELQKCYPDTFKPLYIDLLPSEDERAICELILENNFAEAQLIINSTSPTLRMMAQQNLSSQNSVSTQPQDLTSPAPESPLKERKLGAFKSDQNSIVSAALPYTRDQNLSLQLNPITQKLSSSGADPVRFNSMQVPSQLSNKFVSQSNSRSDSHSLISGGNQQLQKDAQHKHEGLSIVGREIMQSIPKVVQPIIETQNLDQEGAKNLVDESPHLQSRTGVPLDRQNNLAFGFLDPILVDQMNENNQWKERTHAVDKIEEQFLKLLNSNKIPALSEQNATNFLAFIYKFIPDINFKISLSSIKIVTLLLKNDLANIKMYFQAVLSLLIEKFSDSKEVVRDMVEECSANLIKHTKPFIFANQICKNLQHANCYVKEGVLILIIRSIIEQVKIDSGAKNHAKQGTHVDQGLLNISTNQHLIEELCFLVKVEDKKGLKDRSIDTLALLIAKSPQRAKTEQLVLKELGVQNDQVKTLGMTKEGHTYSHIQLRINDNAFPFINEQNKVAFCPQSNVKQGPTQHSLQFLQHKQNEQFQSEAHLAIPQMANVQNNQSMQDLQSKGENLLMASETLTRGGSVTAGPGPLSQMKTHQIELQGGIQQQYKTPSLAFLENKRKEEEKQQKLIQNHPQSAQIKKNVMTPLSPMLAPQQQQIFHNQNSSSISQSAHKNSTDRDQLKFGNQIESDQQSDRKIAMWLPSFSPGPGQIENNLDSQDHFGDQKQFLKINATNPSTQNLPPKPNAMQHGKLQQQKLLSPKDGSLDQRNPTMFKSAHQNMNSQLQNNGPNNLSITSPAFSEKQKQIPGSQGHFRNSVQQSDNFTNFSDNQESSYNPSFTQQNKPRTIISNQEKQRNFNESQGSNNSSNQSSSGQQTISGTTNPTTNSNGFDRSQITERLQLLKSSNKYKVKGSDVVSPDDNNTTQSISMGQEQKAQARTRVINSPATHVQLKQRQIQPQMMSFQSEQKPQTTSQYSNFSDINRGALATQYDELSRISSIDYNQYNPTASNNLNRGRSLNNDRDQKSVISQSEKKPGPASRMKVAEDSTNTLANMMKQDPNQVYEAKEEPLTNPEKQLQQAADNLKSSDWQKNFEACNVIKRAAMFHKPLFAHPSNIAAQIFKDMVKNVDNLRSQVAKNACMALMSIFLELPPRDTDPHIETVLPILLKRSTDTNQFIAQEAEKTMITMVNNCTETRIFTCMQNQNLKGNAYKEKMALLYTVLIDRLAHKIKTFRDLERLIQAVAKFLNEASVEVRNQAKFAVLTLKNVSGSQREFEGILLKARLGDNLMEKVKKVAEQEDFESLSNYANTKYGTSMRMSPLHGARNTQYGESNPNRSKYSAASGSDGFYRHSNMQQTFMSSGATSVPPNIKSGPRSGSSGHIGTNGIGNNTNFSTDKQTFLNIPKGNMSYHGGGNRGTNSAFDNTQNTFNKRTTSVSKPVDRGLVEQFKNTIDACNTQDWQKRLKSIDSLQSFVETNGNAIKNAAQSSHFIQLIDTYCKLIQDNNLKVQTKAQQSFEVVLNIQEISSLINSNLSIIVSALTANLCSTNPAIKNQADRLFDYLEEVVVAESRGNSNNLLQPIVSQLNQNQSKNAKPILVDRLSNLVERVDKQAVLIRVLKPLTEPGHRIQNEANGNIQLKQSLQRLAMALQSAIVGIYGDDIGLKQQY